MGELVIDNNEVEDNLLKLLLTKIELQKYILTNCEANFFENVLNKKIFKAAMDLYNEEKQVDNVSVYQQLGGKDINQRLAEILTETLAYSFAVKRYCEILFNRYINKRIKAAESNKDFEIIKDLQQKYNFEENYIKAIGDDIKIFKERYTNRQNTMLLTGWDNLDNCIGSFCGGDYIALGGSTGTGKSSIALNIAKNLCMQDKSVLYCSLEMPLEQLQNRFNCMVTGLNAMKYRSCGFSKEELEIYEKGLKTLNQWRLSVVCDYSLTTDKLKMYALEKKKTGLDFIIIDYLGLLCDFPNKSLYERATAISRKIKIIATELDVPVLILVQLNRGMADRQDKRPRLSDIRESGAIEQDADFVMFAYRDYIYSYDTYKKNDLEIIIAKNRHGESNAICKFNYDLSSQSISQKWQW